jgi:hypothetical protein
MNIFKKLYLIILKGWEINTFTEYYLLGLMTNKEYLEKMDEIDEEHKRRMNKDDQ